MEPVQDSATRTEKASTERVALTHAAAELLVKLTDIHGPLTFHQSAGCCDGSTATCSMPSSAMSAT